MNGQEAVRSVRRKFTTVGKMAAIAVLILLLLIPLSMIKSVLAERLARRNDAVSGIAATWGTEQVIAGPMLIVPYKHQVSAWRDQIVNGRAERVEVTETVVERACFLPAELRITGQMAPDILHRGIYRAVVYRGTIGMKGTFTKPSFDEWKVSPENVLWEDAMVVLSITDLRGASGDMTITWGDRSLPLLPGTRLPEFPSGLHAKLDSSALGSDTIAFELRLTLNGSRALSFAPLGAQNEARLSSTWPDPSFQGAFLPVERNVGAGGFEALWQVSYFGRSYPQQWSSQDGESPLSATSIGSSLFGVDLIPAVDAYRYVERSIKYGILFISLVFTAFFLFEITAAARIHAFQYTVVGMALCLFYLAVLSLSEIITFGYAYLIGAVASALMVTLYCVSVMRSSLRALAIGAQLCVIYGFLFVILRQQDYALLLGTIGLFIALGVVMYATRKIDWYSRDGGTPSAPGGNKIETCKRENVL